jgi:hypothetical protein
MEVETKRASRNGLARFSSVLVLRGQRLVLQQADFDAAGADVFGGSCFAGDRRITQAFHIDAIHRDVLAEHEITHDRICHFLRRDDCGLPASRGESANFDHVAVLIFQPGRHLIEGLFRPLAQQSLARTKERSRLPTICSAPETRFVTSVAAVVAVWALLDASVA